MDYSKMLISAASNGSNGPKGIRKRKNLSNIHTVLDDAMKSGAIKPGNIVTTKGFRAMIGDEQLNVWFNREHKQFLGDDHGPTRGIGDLMGGHGLKLRGRNGRYEIPKKLPVVRDDVLYEEAVY